MTNRAKPDQPKPLMNALKGVTGSRPPVWLMRQAGRYLPEYRELRRQAVDFLAFCYTPDLATEATLQPIRRFGLDAAILFSDILVIPDALGQKVAFVAGEGPVLESIRSGQEIPRFDEDRFRKHLEPVYETIRRVRTALPGLVALIGFAGAPWTIATYMIEGGSSKDFARTKAWAYGNPDGFARLMDALVEAIGCHVDSQIRAGAEAVQLFDSWAGVLAENAFRRWVIEPTAEIVGRIKGAHPGVPIIGFPRGAGVLYEAFAGETGVDALSLDPSVPPRWAAERLQPRVVVQGNLDPHLLAVGGEEMRTEVAAILGSLGEGPFVFNLGHGVIPTTPPQNVRELVEMVHAWRRLDSE